MTIRFVVKLSLYLYLAAKSHQDYSCCLRKQVDGKVYSYIGTAEENEKKQFGCLDDCVYSQEGSTERFCITQGPFWEQCLEGKAYPAILL